MAQQLGFVADENRMLLFLVEPTIAEEI